jgi:hypothetical protein
MGREKKVSDSYLVGLEKVTPHGEVINLLVGEKN